MRKKPGQEPMVEVLVDVQQDALDRAQAEMEAAGVPVMARKVDVANAAQMEALAKDVLDDVILHFLLHLFDHLLRARGVGSALLFQLAVVWQRLQSFGATI